MSDERIVFEVPLPSGMVTVLLPAGLSAATAAALVARIGAVIRAMFADEEPAPDPRPAEVTE